MENEENVTNEALPENPADEVKNVPEAEKVNEAVPEVPKPEESTQEAVYDFGKLDGLDGLEGFDRRIEAFDAKFKQLAKETGLSPDAAGRIREAMLREQHEAISKAIACEKERIAEADKALRQDWGKEYDLNLKNINDMIFAVDGGKNGEMRQFLAEKGLDSDPTALKILKKVANYFSEDGNVLSKGEAVKKEMTMEEYVRQRRLAALSGMVH